MARIDIISTWSAVRSDVATLLTEGSDLDDFIEILKGLAVAALLEADATKFAAYQDRLDVQLRLTDGGVFSEPSDPTGEVEFLISLGVPDELAYGYSAPDSRVKAYVDAAIASFVAAFVELPNSGADLLTAAGVSDPGEQILTATRVTWGPLIP